MTRLARSSVLGELLAARLGAPAGLRVLAERPSPYRSSFAARELTIRLGDGRRLEVWFKDVGPGGLSAAARRAKPAFLYDPLREIETYRRILGPRKVDAPACYGAVADPRADRYWLFLEKVRGRPLSE